MNVDQVRTYCLAFPGATETLQWGDALCFKINGKMFAVLGLDHVRLTFKCTIEQFVELIERQDIRPSPYLGRHNWVMLERLDALQNDELRALIRNPMRWWPARRQTSVFKSLVRRSSASRKKRLRAKEARRKSRRSAKCSNIPQMLGSPASRLLLGFDSACLGRLASRVRNSGCLEPACDLGINR